MRTSLSRAGLSLALATSLLAPSLSATWSILLVDTRTGEIAVGCATCIPGSNLRAVVPVVVVGRGAACAQASVPFSITNRALIFAMLQQGASPSAILTALAQQDPGHQSRQYGIVDVTGGTVTFTGNGAQAWKGGVTGSVGTIRYAIQGNVLTGLPVVEAATQAVRRTPGDLLAKLMAGMEAARRTGGDGRCSCPTGAPTSCGSPPPSFTKSAHVGFMLVARQGDRDSSCSNTRIGCAAGYYYVSLDSVGTFASPDPVLHLANQLAGFRALQVGRPDHHLSTVVANPPTLLPDPAVATQVTVSLRDWRDVALTQGGAKLTVLEDVSSTAPVVLGPVVDNGDGSYTFRAQPASPGVAGTARLHITVDDGGRPVLLSPRTEIPVRADPLWGSSAQLTAAQGGRVGFRLDAGAGAGLRAYALVASASGTSPGVPLGPGVQLPLNPDALFDASLRLANSPLFVSTVGQLDLGGRATAAFAPGPAVVAGLRGGDVHFAYALLFPFDFASNAVGVGIR